MTSKQIRKALIAGGVDMAGIVNVYRDEVHIAVIDEEAGVADTRKTSKVSRQVAKVLPWKGFITQSGMVVLKRFFDADSAAQMNVD